MTQEQREAAYELGEQTVRQYDMPQEMDETARNSFQDTRSLQNSVDNSSKSGTMVDEKARIREEQLMAMPIQERTTAIEGLLGNYTNKKSKWSGNTIVRSAAEMGSARGRKLWSCDIEVRDNAGIKTIIHELLHARSASNWNPLAYSRWKYSEEAAVELLAQEICGRNGLHFERAYSDKVNKLKIIRNIMFPEKSTYTFAREFYEVDMISRYSWLREQADKLISRRVLSTRTQQILTDAVESFSRRIAK